MNKVWEINHQAFEKMLRWLDQDREIAAQKYEAIRLRLIKVISYRNCPHAEEIADQTFDRAAKKIDQLLDHYEGNPARYLLGIANKILLEYQRKPVFEELSETAAAPEVEENFSLEYECLKKCLENFSPEQRGFIVNYYSKQKSSKIKNHQEMAKQNGLQINNLYVKAFRLRAKLQKCVEQCMAAASF